MLNPTWLGKDLIMLALIDSNDAAFAVKNDAARAGGALIDRGDVLHSGCYTAQSQTSHQIPRLRYFKAGQTWDPPADTCATDRLGLG